MVGSRMDLLDLSAEFKKISLGIFKVGKQHVPGAVATRSIHPLEACVAQMHDGLP